MLFFSTPLQTLYFYIPVIGQPQLWTPFLCPKGVRLWELPLYTKDLLHVHNNITNTFTQCAQIATLHVFAA